MAMRAVHRSKFETLHWQWWLLNMSKKFSSGTKTPKQSMQKRKYGSEFSQIGVLYHVFFKFKWI